MVIIMFHVFRIMYHFVLIPKYRHKVFKEPLLWNVEYPFSKKNSV